jgi:ubiquitin C-terminal hydrolase
MAATEPPLFELVTVRPVGVWTRPDLDASNVKCQLCMRTLTVCTGARSSVVVMHKYNSCNKAFHDDCLTKYFTRPTQAGQKAMQCPSCKADWNADHVDAFNIWTGAQM